MFRKIALLSLFSKSTITLSFLAIADNFNYSQHMETKRKKVKTSIF